MRLIDRAEVRERLTYALCIPIVREAMIAFSTGETRQLLRSIIPLAEGRLFQFEFSGSSAPAFMRLGKLLFDAKTRGRR